MLCVVTKTSKFYCWQFILQKAALKAGQWNCETQKTVNTRNIPGMLLCCKKKQIRCKKTKVHASTAIILRFWACLHVLIFVVIYHNQQTFLRYFNCPDNKLDAKDPKVTFFSLRDVQHWRYTTSLQELVYLISLAPTTACFCVALGKTIDLTLRNALLSLVFNRGSPYRILLCVSP